jgi:hypothetical protein
MIANQQDALRSIASLRTRIEFADKVIWDESRSDTDRNDHRAIATTLVFRMRAISSQYKVRFKDGFCGL